MEIIISCEKSYCSDQLEQAQNDPDQGTWKIINNILKQNQNDTVFNIKKDNEITSKPNQITSAFNEIFSQVVGNLTYNILASSYDPLSQINRLNAPFAFLT